MTGMQPAGENLKTGELPGTEVDERLEVGNDLVRVQGPAKIILTLILHDMKLRRFAIFENPLIVVFFPQSGVGATVLGASFQRSGSCYSGQSKVGDLIHLKSHARRRKYI